MGTARAIDAQPIRLLIVDDHVGVRRGVRALVRDAGDMEVVGEASDGLEAVSKARELRPDVVLMDASMPGLDGIEATRRILAADRGLCVIVLSAFRDLDRDARKAGAAGHLLKDLEPAELLRGIRYAFSGWSTAPTNLGKA